MISSELWPPFPRELHRVFHAIEPQCPGWSARVRSARYNRAVDTHATTLDTSAEAERILVEKWHNMSAAQRLGVAMSLSQSVRELALAGIRQRHPGASPREQLLRLAITLHGPDLATAAYPEIAALDLR